MSFLENINKALQKELPFVAYKKPNDNYLRGYFQDNSQLCFCENFHESGFVFAPFNSNNPSILIPEKESHFYQETIDFDIVIEPKDNVSVIDEEQKQNHIDLVGKSIEAIDNHLFRKVVISRTESVELKEFNVVNTFKKLVVKYPTAFTYLWFHPKVGLWMGATPETLLEVKGTEFKTMSLAGTQVYDQYKEVFWGAKELEEQQLVTDYIIEKLEKEGEQPTEQPLETFRIGDLLHLRTRISGVTQTSITNLIRVLHPTPAVCGFPKEKAKSYILDYEGYDRKFYTGFLGELNIDNGSKSSLYVNLRCMEIEKNQKAILYVGGGITKGSIPSKEWEETIAKSKAMKHIL
ncbi:isochorismate synthase [Tenacibaculum agarivorans]|uniref:isochorismate synthase n=1 Tax=Tenacibaculum agarivorans TaxID=1908389 RepID=UPI00094BBD3E|nr:isochorismate synthase [Tenacibaculum agarivorans]